MAQPPLKPIRTLTYLFSQLNGTNVPSWTSSEIIDENGKVKTAEEAWDIVTAAGTMYSGGIDTVCAKLSPTRSDIG